MGASFGFSHEDENEKDPHETGMLEVVRALVCRQVLASVQGPISRRSSNSSPTSA